MVSDELLNELLKNALAGQAQEFRLDPEDLLRRVREIFTRLVNRDPHYIAAVREASMTVVPSEMNCRTNVLAVAVPVASVPVVLKPVPKVIV